MRFRTLVVLLCALAPIAVRADAPEPIRICIHAPITGATSMPKHPSRFGQFYFDAVNAEQGGVNGRPVQVVVFDDQSYPAGAVAAVEKCRRDGSDLFVGLGGAAQMVAVAKWAEDVQVPYLHGTMSRAQSELIAGDASFAPTTEQFSEGLAHVLSTNAMDLSRGRASVFGMVAIDSPSFDADVASFRAALAARGHDLPVVLRVQKDENQFASIYRELESEEVTIVNMAISPNLMIKMAGQRPLTYDPLFASSQPSMATNFVASAVGRSRMVVLSDPSPAYDASDPDPRWQAEVEEFHRVFDTYSPELQPTRDDTDWMAYLRAKQIHRMLLALDGDVTPQGFFDLFGSHTETPAAAFPTCALDFASDPTFGQDAWHVFVNDEKRRWVEEGFCADASSTTDLAPPRIDCSSLVQVGTEACSFDDGASGIASYSITATPAIGEPTRVDETVACSLNVERRLPLAPGVYWIEATASDCSGRSATSKVALVVI